ncbi:hypothetical protein HHI36_014063 [Cryptolaemus montrouzieri]|uniref:Uncharacterized protein n=1 Tax=Cryptolaemus montrouzieri TaxID=559131 RepID=A0ABD2N1N7_9CUCU
METKDRREMGKPAEDRETGKMRDTIGMEERQKEIESREKEFKPAKIPGDTEKEGVKTQKIKDREEFSKQIPPKESDIEAALRREKGFPEKRDLGERGEIDETTRDQTIKGIRDKDTGFKIAEPVSDAEKISPRVPMETKDRREMGKPPEDRETGKLRDTIGMEERQKEIESREKEFKPAKIPGDTEKEGVKTQKIKDREEFSKQIPPKESDIEAALRREKGFPEKRDLGERGEIDETTRDQTIKGISDKDKGFKIAEPVSDAEKISPLVPMETKDRREMGKPAEDRETGKMRDTIGMEERQREIESREKEFKPSKIPGDTEKEGVKTHEIKDQKLRPTPEDEKKVDASAKSIKIGEKLDVQVSTKEAVRGTALKSDKDFIAEQKLKGEDEKTKIGKKKIDKDRWAVSERERDKRTEEPLSGREVDTSKMPDEIKLRKVYGKLSIEPEILTGEKEGSKKEPDRPKVQDGEKMKSEEYDYMRKQISPQISVEIKQREESRKIEQLLPSERDDLFKIAEYEREIEKDREEKGTLEIVYDAELSEGKGEEQIREDTMSRRTEEWKIIPEAKRDQKLRIPLQDIDEEGKYIGQIYDKELERMKDLKDLRAESEKRLGKLRYDRRRADEQDEIRKFDRLKDKDMKIIQAEEIDMVKKPTPEDRGRHKDLAKLDVEGKGKIPQKMMKPRTSDDKQINIEQQIATDDKMPTIKSIEGSDTIEVIFPPRRALREKDKSLEGYELTKLEEKRKRDESVRKPKQAEMRAEREASAKKTSMKPKEDMIRSTMEYRPSDTDRLPKDKFFPEKERIVPKTEKITSHKSLEERKSKDITKQIIGTSKPTVPSSKLVDTQRYEGKAVTRPPRPRIDTSGVQAGKVLSTDTRFATPKEQAAQRVEQEQIKRPLTPQDMKVLSELLDKIQYAEERRFGDQKPFGKPFEITPSMQIGKNKVCQIRRSAAVATEGSNITTKVSKPAVQPKIFKKPEAKERTHEYQQKRIPSKQFPAKRAPLPKSKERFDSAKSKPLSTKRSKATQEIRRPKKTISATPSRVSSKKPSKIDASKSAKASRLKSTGTSTPSVKPKTIAPKKNVRKIVTDQQQSVSRIRSGQKIKGKKEKRRRKDTTKLEKEIQTEKESRGLAEREDIQKEEEMKRSESEICDCQNLRSRSEVDETSIRKQDNGSQVGGYLGGTGGYGGKIMYSPERRCSSALIGERMREMYKTQYEDRRTTAIQTYLPSGKQLSTYEFEDGLYTVSEGKGFRGKCYVGDTETSFVHMKEWRRAQTRGNLQQGKVMDDLNGFQQEVTKHYLQMTKVQTKLPSRPEQNFSLRKILVTRDTQTTHGAPKSFAEYTNTIKWTPEPQFEWKSKTLSKNLDIPEVFPKIEDKSFEEIIRREMYDRMEEITTEDLDIAYEKIIAQNEPSEKSIEVIFERRRGKSGKYHKRAFLKGRNSNRIELHVGLYGMKNLTGKEKNTKTRVKQKSFSVASIKEKGTLQKDFLSKRGSDSLLLKYTTPKIDKRKKVNLGIEKVAHIVEKLRNSMTSISIGARHKRLLRKLRRRRQPQNINLKKPGRKWNKSRRKKHLAMVIAKVARRSRKPKRIKTRKQRKTNLKKKRRIFNYKEGTKMNFSTKRCEAENVGKILNQEVEFRKQSEMVNLGNELDRMNLEMIHTETIYSKHCLKNFKKMVQPRNCSEKCLEIYWKFSVTKVDAATETLSTKVKFLKEEERWKKNKINKSRKYSEDLDDFPEVSSSGVNDVQKEKWFNCETKHKPKRYNNKIRRFKRTRKNKKVQKQEENSEDAAALVNECSSIICKWKESFEIETDPTEDKCQSNCSSEQQNYFGRPQMNRELNKIIAKKEKPFKNKYDSNLTKFCKCGHKLRKKNEEVSVGNIDRSLDCMKGKTCRHFYETSEIMSLLTNYTSTFAKLCIENECQQNFSEKNVTKTTRISKPINTRGYEDSSCQMTILHEIGIAGKEQRSYASADEMNEQPNAKCETEAHKETFRYSDYIFQDGSKLSKHREIFTASEVAFIEGMKKKFTLPTLRMDENAFDSPISQKFSRKINDKSTIGNCNKEKRNKSVRFVISKEHECTFRNIPISTKILQHGNCSCENPLNCYQKRGKIEPTQYEEYWREMDPEYKNRRKRRRFFFSEMNKIMNEHFLPPREIYKDKRLDITQKKKATIKAKTIIASFSQKNLSCKKKSKLSKMSKKTVVQNGKSPELSKRKLRRQSSKKTSYQVLFLSEIKTFSPILLDFDNKKKMINPDGDRLSTYKMELSEEKIQPDRLQDGGLKNTVLFIRSNDLRKNQTLISEIAGSNVSLQVLLRKAILYDKAISERTEKSESHPENRLSLQ